MTIKENVTVYICDHCKKKLFTKRAMVTHEFGCTYNPANFAACIDCQFCKEVEKEYSDPNDYDHDSDGVKQTKGFQCTKLDLKMYPFKVVKLGLLKKYPEQFEGEVQMPVECAEHEFIW